MLQKKQLQCGLSGYPSFATSTPKCDSMGKVFTNPSKRVISQYFFIRSVSLRSVSLRSCKSHRFCKVTAIWSLGVPELKHPRHGNTENFRRIKTECVFGISATPSSTTFCQEAETMIIRRWMLVFGGANRLVQSDWQPWAQHRRFSQRATDRCHGLNTADFLGRVPRSCSSAKRNR